MAKDGANLSAKIDKLLSEMPDFITSFIYNFGQTEKVATKFEYCKDIRDFLQFIVNFIPEHSEKSIKDLSIDDVANITTLDINRYLTLLQGNASEGLKLSTVKRRRATLSSMYSFFVNIGKMEKNPVLATKP